MFKLLMWDVALLSETVAMITDEGSTSGSFVRGTTGSARVVQVSHKRPASWADDVRDLADSCVSSRHDACSVL